MLYLVIPAVLAFLFIACVIIAVAFRTVVSTNDVHIIQSSKATVSYGSGQPAGNTYYAWPAWIPLIGIQVSRLPVSVFDIRLNNYAAYDKGRVPFVIDVMAFFRVTDTNMAAARISSVQELHHQLEAILQGAVRSILASSDIDHILEGRSQFGDLFTKEVDSQLKEWGVSSVKSIELMDIRDTSDSKVISNIMARKKSLIESESRVDVAANMQKAETAEIEAKRQVELSRQIAEEQIGVRTAEKDQQVGLAKERSNQQVKEEQKTTAEKQMAVAQVEHVRAAEIAKQVEVVKAEQDKQTVTLVAEGQLASTKLRAEGIAAEGRAKADAEKAMQLAPVQAQIELAKEIGTNEGYQTYLVQIRTIEANQVVGIEQAVALQKAEIKVIANAGDVQGGVKNVLDLLTPKGGTQLAGMVEAFAQTDMGRNLLTKVKPVLPAVNAAE